MFNVHIQSMLLQRVPVTGTGKKGVGVRGDRLHWRVQRSTSSQTGIGSKLGVVGVNNRKYLNARLQPLPVVWIRPYREMAVHYKDVFQS